MAVWYINSVAWTAVIAWATGAVKAAGVLVRQLAAPAVNNERVFVSIVAGTTHATTEPTWVVTKGAKTTDNTVTWQECTGQPGVNGDLTNCPTWNTVKNTAVALGAVIQNVAGTYLFICSTAGTAGNGAEPSWTLTAGVTTADNTVTWTCIGVVGNFGVYAAPHARRGAAEAANWGAAGDTFFLADNHAETQASNNTMSSPSTAAAPCKYLCVDRTKAPPGSGDLKATASISITGDLTSLTISNGGYNYGIIFNAAGGGNRTSIGLNASGTFPRTVFEKCSFRLLTTSAAGFNIPVSGIPAEVELVNTTVQFGNIGDGFWINAGCRLRWRDTPSAVLGSTFPTALLNASNPGSIEIEGVDLSALGTTIIYRSDTGAYAAKLINCKLGSGYVLGSPGGSGGSIELINCDSGALNYQTSRATMEGSHVVSAAVVRTGGNSDGVTPTSWKIVTTSKASSYTPFVCMKVLADNLVLATNRVVSLAGIWNSASLPNNDDIWLEARYLGSSGSPLSSVATQTKANGLAAGSALPADSTSAWGSAATVRANTHAYSVGDIIALASNPGRIFFCTTAGTSAGSEPGGYATAVDGGSVTDSGAVFRAGVRFTLTVTLSSPQPALNGYIHATVRAGKPSSTFYIDPLIALG